MCYGKHCDESSSGSVSVMTVVVVMTCRLSVACESDRQCAIWFNLSCSNCCQKAYPRYAFEYRARTFPPHTIISTATAAIRIVIAVLIDIIVTAFVYSLFPSLSFSFSLSFSLSPSPFLFFFLSLFRSLPLSSLLGTQYLLEYDLLSVVRLCNCVCFSLSPLEMESE